MDTEWSSSLDYDKINELDEKHSPKEEYKDKIFSYGTAGFRTHGDALDRVCFRVGIVTAIRASETGTAGVMITASHNPMEDNGVKIIDKNGNMVDMSWESIFTDMVNSKDLKTDLQSLLSSKATAKNENARVMIACDTRESSPRLIDALKAGIEAMGVTVKDFGLLTTPQLHFLIWYADRENYTPETIDTMSESIYYEYYKVGFEDYWKLIEKETTNYQADMIIDAADGIGGIQVRKLDLYQRADNYNLKPIIINDGQSGTISLNDKCGAECIHKEKQFPKDWDKSSDPEKFKWISFDGDADRIVYYYGNPSTNELNIVDGDKIAILLGDYIKNLINEIYNDKVKLSDLITFAVVQTGYANSSATKYLTDKGVTVESTPTGVKYLHHRAQEFDIGVYFEANGHGTIITKYEKIKGVLESNDFPPEDSRVNKFLKFLLLTNEAVGDAMATLLMVEACLKDTDMSIQQANTIYTDLPSRMLKLTVNDREKFVTEAHNETILLQPAGLQDEITQACGNYEGSRAFVRPSGTEDVVRIYAEGKTQQDADALAQAVMDIVDSKYKDV